MNRQHTIDLSPQVERAFLIAVECAVAGGTRFCASMDARPGVEDGFDIALTELPPVGEATAHDLLARASDAGPAPAEDVSA